MSEKTELEYSNNLRLSRSYDVSIQDTHVVEEQDHNNIDRIQSNQSISAVNESIDPNSFYNTLYNDIHKLKGFLNTIPIIKFFHSLSLSQDDNNLIHQVNELLLEWELQRVNVFNILKDSTRLNSIVNNDSSMEGNIHVLIRMNINSILITLTEITEYLRINCTKNPTIMFVFSNKAKYVKRIHYYSLTLRSKMNQLMTSITMYLLNTDTKKSDDVTEETITLQDAYSYYYGIHGRSRNYKLAFSKLIYLSENDGNSDAMLLLSECYANGHGLLYPDASLSRKWLEKSAITCNNILAKARFGSLLIQESNDGDLDPMTSGNYFQRGRDLLIDAAVNKCVEAELSLGILSYDAEDYLQAHDW